MGYKEVHLVVGNEAADLDSIVGAFARAFFLQAGARPGIAHIPIVNVSRHEFTLRREAAYLFALLDIDAKQLVFRDEVPNEILRQHEGFLVDLVDHNQLTIGQEEWASSVTSIVDHHADTKEEYPLLDSKDKQITVVGSATTLVAQQILENKPSLIDRPLATLLLGAILLDTGNLEKKKKTTDRDRWVVEQLTKIADNLVPSEFHDDLLKNLHDVKDYTPMMVLRRDLCSYREEYFHYTISAVRYNGPEDGSSFTTALKQLAAEKGAPIAIAMITKPPKGLWSLYQSLWNLWSLWSLCSGMDRRVAIYCRTGDLLDAVVEHLSEETHGLVLTRTEGCTAFYLLRNDMNRKSFQPKLQLGSSEAIAQAVLS